MASWYSKYLETYGKNLYDIDSNIITQIKEKGRLINTEDNPVVTVSVIAYNEEKHLIPCIWSLVNQKCKYPIEIIGVNNDSKDKTAEVFKACGIPFHTETRHSCGWARLCGLTHARGKYHLNIDADTMYPPTYVETMVDALECANVVGVSGTWSYFPDAKHSRLGLFFYEKTRDFYLWLQHFKRPELSVRGLVFGYNTKLAQKIGIRTDIIRGEDGSLALELKQYGKIRFIHSSKVRAITGYGTMDEGGSFLARFTRVALYRISNLSSLFHSKKYYKDEDSNLVKN